MENDSLIIPRNSKAFKKVIVVSIISGAVIGISMSSLWYSASSQRTVYLQLLTLLAILIAAFLLNAIVQLLKKTPALILDDKGITDKISYAKAGFIAWEKVDFVELKQFNGSLHLLIFLKDGLNSISEQLGPRKRLAENIFKRTGAAIALNAPLLSYDIDVLKAEIESRISN